MSVLDEVEVPYDPREPLSDAMLLDPVPWRLIKAKFFHTTPGSVFPITAHVPKGPNLGNLSGVTFLISEDYFNTNPIGNDTADLMVRALLAPYFKELENIAKRPVH